MCPPTPGYYTLTGGAVRVRGRARARGRVRVRGRAPAACAPTRG